MPLTLAIGDQKVWNRRGQAFGASWKKSDNSAVSWSSPTADEALLAELEIGSKSSRTGGPRAHAGGQSRVPVANILGGSGGWHEGQGAAA